MTFGQIVAILTMENVFNFIRNIQDAQAGNATENLHPTLVQKTHIQLHTHYTSQTSVRLQYTSDIQYRSTALVRSVVDIYYLVINL